MENDLFPLPSPTFSVKRNEFAPETLAAWRNFSREVFEDGALSGKMKDLIAIAVAHTTQCPYCIRAHTKRALEKGASGQEIMEAIWVAAEMRAGAATAHSNLAMDEIIKAGK